MKGFVKKSLSISILILILLNSFLITDIKDPLHNFINPIRKKRILSELLLEIDMDYKIDLQLLHETVGINIRIISDDYNEIPTGMDVNNTHHKIVFQIEEEEPDIFAFGVLFTLSLLSFVYAAPRGISEINFIASEDWNLDYFMNGLEFKNKCLCFSADYISGRLMKTDIRFESGGQVTLITRNRGKSADRWLLNLQGKKHIQMVK